MNYQAALDSLNSLITNRAYLDRINSPNYDRKYLENLPSMLKCCNIVGLDDSQLNSLNVIHVTGTKGKGSTCAFSERLLRTRGWKTGFYSSPHLIDVRERIRINGQPLSTDKFNDYFWPIFNALSTLPDGQRPFYFQFLTVMAFKVFIEEKVDVAIIEVGIGGRHDCTTVVKNPVVCGITSLGYDHMNVLGETIEAIAENKAGIIRGDCVTFTVEQEHKVVDNILKAEAHRQKSPLFVVPIVTKDLQLTEIQSVNSSLAIYLTHWWEQRFQMTIKERQCDNEQLLLNSSQLKAAMESIEVDEISKQAIKSTVWLGRQQILVHNQQLTFYIDGAHTMESLEKCADWFLKSTNVENQKILIFNITGKRNAALLMEKLKNIPFHSVLFTTNLIYDEEDSDNSQVSSESPEEMHERCQRLAEEWLNLSKQYKEMTKSIYIKKNVSETIKSVESMANELALSSSHPVEVLVTGSLILVGSFLTVVDPNCVTRLS